MTRRPARSFLPFVLAASLVAGACSDYRIISVPKPAGPTVNLPSIGFNHLYGNNPIAARDGFSMERQFFSERVFWEVYLFTQPVQRGFVSLGNAEQVRAARHQVTEAVLTVATEDPTTIDRFLASPGVAGQQTYAEQLLQEVVSLGYDNVSTAQVHIYFGELHEYATLAWAKAAGYSYDVILQGYGQVQGQPPLPAPQAPTTLPPAAPTSP